ncbi:hypothetical protein [Mixta intestinalis]|uniref:Uncharacterized protein n=1 Tax=Mixta intestinalis TaxID=1615494 RepID=A0A6P1Q2C5_9GAMM|nr:hypothetical protein [Mixta intestinalis]QHM72753.1 hypothetical protein C7M51_03071 [Mixta intestinalis]
MADLQLIDTLELGDDAESHYKYEIYGADDATPEYALIFTRQGENEEWQQSDKLPFAAADEKQEATSGTMDYGSGDSLPDLRDLRQEAKERCEQHYRENR